ncbi:MAG: amino acid adenylation domain-containing protein [Phycisphaerae bacterium]|nr:amino acid adenylation domain-containing protein [Phycisphaerae bacterium]
MGVHDPILTAITVRGDHPAVIEPSGKTLSYGRLGEVSAALRDRLAAIGVTRGDRVGIMLRKSADSVASILGVLRAGAGYVPTDPGAPPSRAAYIFSHCAVKAVIVEQRFVEALSAELAKAGAAPTLIITDGIGGAEPLHARLRDLQAASPAPAVPDVSTSDPDLAYILYTSGSTGRPKGVTLTHQNARTFVEWCTEAFSPRPDDRFSAHAPFHFDLSILDIFVSLTHGATLMVIDEDLGKEPLALAAYIASARISIWYSAPSILSLLAQRGRLGEHDYSALRTVLFAGEVFPVVHLRSLQKQWPRPRYYNLYGPTETNVCTFLEVPGLIPDDRTEPYPIGKVCSHLRGLVADEDGKPLPADAEGELCITGPGVMTGYWAQPDLTAKAFITTPDGTRWYRTGDIVSLDGNADYRYLGRRDRMIKKRGYRVELGEIEACLYRHPDVKEAAVVALPDDALGQRVVAHLGTASGQRLSLIKLKQFCAENLPVYMVPDAFAFHAALPKTSTGKTDYQTLKAQSAAPAAGAPA